MLLALAPGCGPEQGAGPGSSALYVDFSEREIERIAQLMGPPPLPPDPTNAVADDPAAAALGQRLYFDPRFSGDGSVSCATCHDPALGFSDGQRLSEGLGTTTRHAPTVLDAAVQRWFFWDGRCDSLWCQATQPWEAAGEHGGSRLQFAHLVADDAALREAYEAIFGPLPDLDDLDRFPPEGKPTGDSEDPLDRAWSGMSEADQVAINTVFTDLTKSVAAYERLLVSGPSPFDRFARGLIDGDEELLASLDEAQQRGLKLFINDNPSNPFHDEAISEPGAECYACHGGPELSDREFHNIGLGARDWLTWEDLGRYEGAERVVEDPFNGIGPYSDDPQAASNDKLVYLREPDGLELGQFKTPSLRNVALRPPYMHGGHFDTLEDVLGFYTRLDESPVISHRDEQLYPLDHLDEEDLADLLAFLEALTGEAPDPSLLAPP